MVLLSRSIRRLGAVALLIPGAVDAQVRVSGRVVNNSNAPLSGAAVGFTRGDVGRRIATDAAGRFEVVLPDTGVYEVRVELIGYIARTDTLQVTGPRDRLEFRLSVDAVRLDPLRIESEARRWSDIPQPVSRSHVLSGSEMAALEKNNVSMSSAVRRMPGLRIRRADVRDRLGRRRMIDCYEVARRQATLTQTTGCDAVVVIIDGAEMDDPVEVAEFMRTERISSYESMQLLTPTQAQQRFGMDAGARGAILFFTRGRGPHLSDARNKH